MHARIHAPDHSTRINIKLHQHRLERVYGCVRLCMYVCVRVRAPTSRGVCMSARMRVCVCAHVYVYVCACVCVYMCVHVHVCACV